MVHSPEMEPRSVVRATLDTSDLRRLLAQLGAPVGDGPIDEWLDGLVAWSQRTLDFRQGRERWEIDALETDLASPGEVQIAAGSLGMVGDSLPTCWVVDDLVVLGASAPEPECRLRFAREMAEFGLEFRRLVLLGSDRELNSWEGSGTEAEMMTAAAKREFPGQPATVLSASKGSRARAVTSDTFSLYRDLGPGERVLIVTTDRFVPFQAFDAFADLGGVATHIEVVGYHPLWNPARNGPVHLLQEMNSAFRAARRWVASSSAAGD